MTHGERILIERRRRRLGQRDLARLADLNTATIVDIERGRVEITEADFHRIMGCMMALDSEAIPA